jgi:endo-1,4-beta-D-glucanase Y
MIVGWTKYDEQQDDLSANQAAIESQTVRLAAYDASLKASRKATTRVFCDTLNGIQETLRGMIINGAKASALFEDIYRDHGAPPYAQRVAEAQTNANKLKGLDCSALEESVEKNAAPPPPRIRERE